MYQASEFSRSPCALSVLRGPAEDPLTNAALTPRLAATLVALIDSRCDLEALLPQRSQRVGFAPAARVFPGGVTEPQDSQLGWTSPATAKRAAIRETQEEPRGLAGRERTFTMCLLDHIREREQTFGNRVLCWQGAVAECRDDHRSKRNYRFSLALTSGRFTRQRTKFNGTQLVPFAIACSAIRLEYIHSGDKIVFSRLDQSAERRAADL